MACFSIARKTLHPELLGKGLAGFRNRTPADLQPSGVTELDALLGGGFPRGSLVEICGPVSSGRSSLGVALLTQATGHAEACAFIDVSDSLDPVSLAAAGADLSRLLWIRCGEEARGNSPPLANTEHSEKKKDNSGVPDRAKETQTRGFSWQHPRNQIHGVETFIPQLMRKKESGKEEPNLYENSVKAHEQLRLSLVPRCSEEQVESDRQLPRRGENIRKQRHFPLRLHIHPQLPQPTFSKERKPWKRLEQALKAADLLLHGGGWGLVVFDLGGISWVHARRIPLSTWFRFQRTIESTPTILLLLAEDSCAKSCASVVLRCQRLRENWDSANFASPASCSSPTQSPATLRSFEIQGEIVRSRMHLPSSISASWETHTIWNDNF